MTYLLVDSTVNKMQYKILQETSSQISKPIQLSGSQREGKSCDSAVARSAAALCTVPSRDRYFLGDSGPVLQTLSKISCDENIEALMKYSVELSHVFWLKINLLYNKQ